MQQDIKRALIRAVWGDISANGIRNGKLYNDIELVRTNPYSKPIECPVYVFGSDNFNILTQLGFNCKLIDSNPVRYDMKTQLYRHKLDVLFEAMKDFDEIVFIDWDCRQTASLPNDFWEAMGKKAPFQANLFQYRTKKCLWRNIDWRKVCNGGWLYIREKNIPLEFINNYNELAEWMLKKKEERERRGKKLRFREECLMFDDEPSFSKWVDDYMGGWKGTEEYWKSFEPEFCNLRNKSAFSSELLKTKRECFLHWGPK